MAEIIRPVDNAPLLRHQHAGLTIEGYSRAAVQSYWRVPELKLGFDLGAQPWEFMGTPTWFVTHPHLDHMAALPVYVARRRMMRMEPPVIYMPEAIVEDARRLLLIMQRLDRGRMVCELKGVRPGDEIALSREHVATVFATTHTVPSVSFIRAAHRREKIHKFGHMHLDDFLERADRFQNELIICGHYSTRYHPDEVRRYVAGKLPPGLKERLLVWV